MKHIIIGMFCLVSATAFSQKAPAVFKAGDKIAFVGNSITENGFYELYIWQYYQLHFPKQKLLVMNKGIGGDVAGNILARIDEDVLKAKPTTVVLTFGMNDSRYFEYFNTSEDKVRKDAVDTSYKNYLAIEQKLKNVPSISKILMTSSPYDETVTGPKMNFHGKYKTMQLIATFQKEAAIKNNWGYVDLMNPMTVIDQEQQKTDTNFTLTGPDRIHPGNAGHFAMAWLFLKAQGLANSVVADVSVDAKKAKSIKSGNCIVSGIKKITNGISFDYLANSLPFPSDSVARLWGNPQKQEDALKVIPFTKEFNQELLTIKNLDATSKYAVFIDDEKIGEWSDNDLANGINLAEIANTPQYKQAQQVAELNLQHRELEQKIRAYYWLQFDYFRQKGMMYQDDQAAMDSVLVETPKNWAVASKKDNYIEGRKKEVREGWQKEMNAIVDKIYTVNQPLKRRIKIEKVK